MSTGRAIWTLFSTVASIVIVVLVIQSCDRTAHNLGSGLSKASTQLQQAANQLQHQINQAKQAQQKAAARIVKQRQHLLDGKRCRVGNYRGTIVVESMTAAHPGRADCV